MTTFPVVIHHNPLCGTSRNVLEIIRAAGYEPTVIDYMKEGWTCPQLLALFAAAGITTREALRVARSPAEGCCQTNANQSPLGQCHCPLCHAKAAPLGESGGAVQFEEVSTGEAAFLVEMIQDGSMNGGELLKTSHTPEPKHRPLSSSKRQVRVLRPVLSD